MQQLPLTDMVGDFRGKEYLLAAVGGHLSLIVVESLEVSIFMLTMSSASASALAWSRQLVIRTPEIERWAGMDVDSISAFLPVGGFGERSGTLVMQLKNGDLVRLELGTKEVTTLRQGMVRIGEVFLHEIDLPSLLQAMKSY
ncbi:hypothetical protein PR202_ga13670 [Eleusine coracana subsp. coracana]|uniref:DUF7595 domain-containing protein n=1 Tax=Eleusine coracana subsp. coracana TaxID=191504 RepID=A0AAV5CEP6_ELECO|nr:hypothetical protein PR202_ga13670 [Eleusine coracana subsp. coracana]